MNLPRLACGHSNLQIPPFLIEINRFHYRVGIDEVLNLICENIQFPYFLKGGPTQVKTTTPENTVDGGATFTRCFLNELWSVRILINAISFSFVSTSSSYQTKWISTLLSIKCGVGPLSRAKIIFQLWSRTKHFESY